MAIAFTLIETPKLNDVDPKSGSHGPLPKSLITKSPTSKSSSHGVTLPPQRNNLRTESTGQVQRTGTL